MQNDLIEIVFLGTGTSQGVPVIACECDVCTSNDPRDNRLRTSIMLSYRGKNIVIDSGPDFRQQMLRQKVMHLDAIVYTHEHKDHVAGMDDVRAYNYKQQSDMQLYGSFRVEEAIRREFHYAFTEKKYPGIPEVVFNRIDNDPFPLLGLHFIPVEVMHYHLPVQGFRINDISYITDANYIAPEEIEKIKGSRILIINALRKQSHPSHFNLEEALQLIEQIKPQQAYLIHISHLMGKHADVANELPKGVQIAWDGLRIC